METDGYANSPIFADQTDIAFEGPWRRRYSQHVCATSADLRYYSRRVRVQI
jgi:hypothetical protein